MQDEHVTLTFDGPVAEVMLARPEKRNALDMEMFTALVAAGEELRDTPGLAAVILHGAGVGFCAGIDTSLFAAFAGRLEATRTAMLAPPLGTANPFQRPCTVWADVPVPVIAAIHGTAYGAGLQLALGADIRISAPDARFSVMEAKWGLAPDMGLSQSLPRLMRADLALDLIVSARVVQGTEAAAIGLVTRTADDPLAEARAMAARLTHVSPAVLRAAKRLVQASWQRDPAVLRLEAELQAAIIGTPNQIEAVTATLERRNPRFT